MPTNNPSSSSAPRSNDKSSAGSQTVKYNPAMSFKLVEKQVVYTGKKLRLEIHHLEDEEREGHDHVQNADLFVVDRG